MGARRLGGSSAMKRKTKALLLLTPLSALILWLDALEPGWGQFYNPAFWVRSQLSKLDTAWRELPTVDASDPRLKECIQFTSDTVLSDVQEQARAIVTGKTESFAIQQLGLPTCALTEDVYRWVTESGLAVDVKIVDGEVEDAQLNR